MVSTFKLSALGGTQAAIYRVAAQGGTTEYEVYNMARSKHNPLLDKPYTYIERCDAERLPSVVLPSIPSKIRKHHASSGHSSVLMAMRLYSGRQVIINKQDGSVRRRDRGIKLGFVRVRVIKRQTAE